MTRVNEGIELIAKLSSVATQYRQAADPIEAHRFERKSQSVNVVNGMNASRLSA